MFFKRPADMEDVGSTDSAPQRSAERAA
jgi:hypothetical protein